MSQMKKSVQKEQAQRNMYVTLCVVALVALIGYGALSVVDVFTVDQPKMLDSKQVEVLGRTHYRFREIYRGPSMEAHHSSSSAPVVSASHSSLSSGSHAASSSAVVPSANGSVSMSGASASGSALHTTSSAESHAYGGGYSAGGMTSGSSSVANITPMAAYPSSSAMPFPSVKRTYASNMRVGASGVTSGPRQVMVWDPELEEWVDDSTPASPQEGDTKIEDGKAWVYKDGVWVILSDQSDPGVPLGDLPILVMFILLVGFAFYRKKHSARLV